MKSQILIIVNLLSYLMMASPEHVSIVCWNARGFSGSIPYIRQLLKHNDIVLLSEHWLHNNRLRLLEDIGDEICYCARSSKFSSADEYGSKRGQGGVAVIWKKNLSGVSEITDITYDRACGIRLQTKKGGVLNIISIYLPAAGSPEPFGASLDELSEILDTREDGSLNIVGGDANGDIGHMGGPRSTRVPSKQGKMLAGFMREFGLFAPNMCLEATGPIDTHEGPTGSSTIDYVLLPHSLHDKVVTCGVSDEEALCTSDHRAVRVVLNLNAIRDRVVHTQGVKRRRWDKCSPEDIYTLYQVPLERSIDVIRTMLEHDELTNEMVDHAIETLVVCITNAAESIPVSKFKRNVKPYWNQTLTMLKRDKIFHYKKWVWAGRPRSRDDTLWVSYKRSKNTFSRELRKLSKLYDEEEVAKTVESVEADKNIFWRFLKKCRKPGGGKTLAIRNQAGKVVYDIEGVLDTWKCHFEHLCSPHSNEEYDQDHFERVNERVEALNAADDMDEFLSTPFTVDELKRGISKLNMGKASGFDNVSAEHLKYAGDPMAEVLTLLYNKIVTMEFIPSNFRCGIQVPLYKGKNTCSLDVNNYRGITLLTTLNKLFEILLWNRMEKWWWDSGIVSRFQGACRRKQSCVHTALLLQETVSNALDAGKRVFVSYFDVSKAFDTVWTNGLFYQMHQNGVVGRTWRLMYRTYIGFKCKVRIGESMSNWYPMTVGIHQGGFLSLVKYISFINSLIVEIEESSMCCSIGGIPSTPAGYADDLATACLAKWKTDRVHNMVFNHSRKWRYNLNAKKSAVLVYGEGRAENARNSKYRQFSLGRERVKERVSYDHVGVRACIEHDNEDRVKDKISSGRRALNAASSLGIRKKGLNMASCNLIFWMIIVPIITFGSEIWVLTDKDSENLISFQRYAGRRIQRFPYRSPIGSSFAALGWLRLTTYICIKKLMFILSILRLGPKSVVYEIFIKRFEYFDNDVERGMVNKCSSPVFDMLNGCRKLGIYGRIKKIIAGVEIIPSKYKWKTYVWERAWAYEDLYWDSTRVIYRENDLLSNTSGIAKFTVWWWISDKWPKLIGMCETIVRILCHASKLKIDDYRLHGMSHSHIACDRCDIYAKEDIHHILMQCPYFHNERVSMYERIRAINPNMCAALEQSQGDMIYHLMGKMIEGYPWDDQVKMWCISGQVISTIYYTLIKGRSGIG